VTDGGREALALYGGLGASTRIHVLVRWASCPFPRIAEEIPASGRVLEVGCGHGLFSSYLALQSHRRDVHGVDLDADKIERARVVAGRAAARGGTLSFDVAPSGAVPPGPWSAITIVDVLYLLDPAGQRRLIAECARQLAPGGVLVIKEMSSSPRWKFRWNALQELLSVRVLRITEGSEMSFLTTGELTDAMRDAGLQVTMSRPIHRGRPHPHHLVVARAPDSPPTG
jgi:2-polyprenyl-3-methyl-5-hydroxy-6-metoxy-1,4-benzoquinol methylase